MLLITQNCRDFILFMRFFPVNTQDHGIVRRVELVGFPLNHFYIFWGGGMSS